MTRHVDMVADQMRAALPPGIDIPAELRDTPGPLVILRWTAQHTPHDLAAQVDQASTAGEGSRRQGVRPDLAGADAINDSNAALADLIRAARQPANPPARHMHCR